jgi:hypothetical protein
LPSVTSETVPALIFMDAAPETMVTDAPSPRSITPPLARVRAAVVSAGTEASCAVASAASYTPVSVESMGAAASLMTCCEYSPAA